MRHGDRWGAGCRWWLASGRSGSLLLVTGLLVLASCGGDPDVVDVGESAGSDAPVVPATPSETAIAGAAGDAASAQDALLTVEDLPDGWSEVEAGDQDTGNCLDALTGEDSPFGIPGAATASFAGSALGPFVVASVTSVSAQEALPAVDDLLTACDGDSGPDGLVTTVEAVAIDGVPAGSLTVRGAQEDPAGGGVEFAVGATGGPDGAAFVLALSPVEEVGDDLVAEALVTMADRLTRS